LDKSTPAERIAIDQVRRMSAQSTLGIIATMVNAVVVALILAETVSRVRIGIWFGLVIAVSILRILSQQHVQNSELTSDNIRRHMTVLLAGLTISGCLWGSAGIYLFPVTSLAHQVLLILVLGGMVAGSVGVFASLMTAYYFYSIPTVLPMVIRISLVGEGMHYGMAVMMVLFWFLMTATAKRLNRDIRAFLHLKYENIDLIRDLEKEVSERRSAEEKLLAKNQEIESIVEARTTELRRVNEQLRGEINDRVEAEKALRESRKKFIEFANSLPQVVFETDHSGNLTFANRNAVNYFGNFDNPSDLSVFDMIAPEERKRAKANFQAILNNDPRDSVEYTAVSRDGGSFPVVIHADLVQHEGKATGIRGILVDLSEIKKAEEEQRQLELQLQRAQKMEILGTMAGGVAHDLNNILSGIVSYPDLLLAQISEDSPLYSPIQTMKKSGKKAAAIVQDLLTLARRGVISEEVVNLNDVVSEYLQSPEYQKLLSFHRDICIDVNLDSDLLNIIGSRVHLAKTIMNLVSNAAEAMPDGGEITIATANQYIDQPLSGYDEIEEGDYAILSVADSGVGIAVEDVERIFEPFFTKKVMGRSGTGLGMAVVWGTVKDHKGYIDVKSSEGRGSEFSLYFPVTRNKEISADTSSQGPDYRGDGELVLIVDDVPEQRMIASDMLTSLGYCVEAVPSGEAAVKWLSEKQADLILLDMIMDPGMDGLETYRRILQIRKGQKALIASGYSETDRVKVALEIGAGAYLRKPYTLKNLGQAVHETLHREHP
jgi:PAS domain S-box-containing protein